MSATTAPAVHLFTLMNSALGPLIRRLGWKPNRRVNRPKKTPATRPALIGKAEELPSNRWPEAGDSTNALGDLKVLEATITR
jgi:hypothetical protein